jgi:hypothetical protein
VVVVVSGGADVMQGPEGCGGADVMQGPAVNRINTMHRHCSVSYFFFCLYSILLFHG